MAKKAILIIDMLNDFVHGKLKSERTKHVIPNIKKIIEISRRKSYPIIYVNDAHIKGIDHELKLWGEHAIKGTKGAMVVDSLKPNKNDFVFEKRSYSGFFNTGLELLLKQMKVDTLVITGIYGNLCVLHTIADAFQYGYNVIVPKECIECFTDEEYNSAIDTYKKYYNAKIIKTKEFD